MVAGAAHRTEVAVGAGSPDIAGLEVARGAERHRHLQTVRRRDSGMVHHSVVAAGADRNLGEEAADSRRRIDPVGAGLRREVAEVVRRAADSNHPAGEEVGRKAGILGKT
jgi:hypothetical protein